MSGDRELMNLHDGEVGPEQSARLRAEAAADPVASAKLRDLGRVGDLVREWAEARSQGFDVADAVMARLDVPVPRRSRVVELWLPAAAAVALAAAVLFVVTTRETGVEGSAPPVALGPGCGDRELGEALPALPSPEPSVAIESVDFGEKQGTIFMVGGEGGDTPVIWLTDSAPSRMPSL
jgi:hypothetical protein